MRLKDTLHFNEEDYCTRIRKHNYTFGELARRIYTKRRNITTAKVSVASGIVCAHVSGGVSLVGSAYAGRNISVEKQKLTLLEHLWASTGMDPLPQQAAKDVLIPVIISTAIGVLTFTVDLGISNAVATAAYAPQAGICGDVPINSHLITNDVETGLEGAGKHVGIGGHQQEWGQIGALGQDEASSQTQNEARCENVKGPYATAADASQADICGYALPINSHLIAGAFHDVETGMKVAGKYVNGKIAHWRSSTGVGLDRSIEPGRSIEPDTE